MPYWPWIYRTRPILAVPTPTTALRIPRFLLRMLLPKSSSLDGMHGSLLLSKFPSHRSFGNLIMGCDFSCFEICGTYHHHDHHLSRHASVYGSGTPQRTAAGGLGSGRPRFLVFTGYGAQLEPPVPSIRSVERAENFFLYNYNKQTTLQTYFIH